MAWEYNPNLRDHNPFRIKYCKASVRGYRGWGSHQCTRKIWKDGWCKQHHPKSEKNRQIESDKRYEAKRLAGPWGQLEVLQKQHDALTQYIMDRGLISVRKMAKIMNCNIDDITEDI